MAENIKIIQNNKRAHFDYNIIETYEAGIVLFGTEIKSIRLGKVSFNDAYCEIINGEMFIKGLHISKYELGNIFNHDPDRTKKLLLNKSEILRLNNKKTKDGYTIIPIKIYISGGLAKIEIALVQGKKLYDKRESLKEEDQKRYIEKMGKVR